ncbi:MAG: pyridoxal phosphate-dependent aminotransferase [Myxococcota bacterium]
MANSDTSRPPYEPRLATRTAGLRPSLYARLLRRLESYAGEVYPFHIGESWLLPDPSVKRALAELDEHSVHRYGHPQGLPVLRELIADQLTHAGPAVSADNVVVTHGATHGLHLACQALLDPGDEVLVLSPHWPLINGMITAASAIPVEVPFTCRLRNEALAPISIDDLIRPYLSSRTKAVYVTSPNNPDGVVLDERELAQLARVCVDHNLLALVDEAYDRFCFHHRPPPLTAFPGMEERAGRLFRLPKSHRLAGLRVGFASAPVPICDAMVRLANLSVYNVSLLVQRAALAALADGEESVQVSCAAAENGHRVLLDALHGIDGLVFRPAQGGAYLFVDLAAFLKGRTCAELLDEAVTRGVLFAPGVGFGSAYQSHARLCFTSMPPERMVRGVQRFKELLHHLA